MEEVVRTEDSAVRESVDISSLTTFPTVCMSLVDSLKNLKGDEEKVF